jgi:SulP family sulfate permease
MLLNLNGIELGVRRDLDMNRELMVEGTGNLLAGLGGGFAGYNTLSLSLLGPKTGTTTRLIPLTAALVCGATLFLGAEAMTFFPKFLLGGMVFLVGLFFLDDWVFSGWKKFSPMDFSIVLLIVGTIVWFGFLQGVGLGLGLAIFIFIIRISRIPVIAGIYTGNELHSTRTRSIPDQSILRRHGSRTRIFTLTGYIFFGSAGSLGTSVSNCLKEKTTPSYLVLDLSAVTGFDASAVNTIHRTAQRVQASNAQLILAGAPGRLAELLRSNTDPEVMADIHFSANLDEALEHCENALLVREQTRWNSQKEHAEISRRALFEDTAEAMESHLASLMQFEELADRLAPFGSMKKYRAGETIIEQGQDPEGIFLLLWGTVSEFLEASPQRTRIRTLNQGSILGIPAVLASWALPSSLEADRDSTLLFLHRDAYRTLEKSHQELDQALTRLLLEHACNRQAPLESRFKNRQHFK